MEPLDPDDYRRVLSAVAVLGQDADWEGFPARAVDAVCSLVEVEFVSYNEVDPGSGQGRFLLRPDVGDFDPNDPAYAAFLRRFGNHPLIAFDLGAGPRSHLPAFLRSPKVLSLGVGKCCGAAELRLSVGLDLSGGAGVLVGIGASRAVRDFDRRDEARLAALQPHLSAACRIALRGRPSPAAPLSGELPLTRRESEVLYWVAMGKTNEEIGIILGAKGPTVKKHLEHIYLKLQVPNRTAAAMMMRAVSARPAPA